MPQQDFKSMNLPIDFLNWILAAKYVVISRIVCAVYCYVLLGRNRIYKSNVGRKNWAATMGLKEKWWIRVLFCWIDGWLSVRCTRFNRRCTELCWHPDSDVCILHAASFHSCWACAHRRSFSNDLFFVSLALCDMQGSRDALRDVAERWMENSVERKDAIKKIKLHNEE